MTEQSADFTMERQEPFVGEWEMEVTFPGASPMGGAGTTFERIPGKRLLVQRRAIPIPDAPDGLAVYAYDERRKTVLQHSTSPTGRFDLR